ncbi:glycoside hydrolase family 3 C-terminal domain-containing protein [Isoptericola sp. b441]|uniref:Glycoside hydrolase family 3 C-terminal domain-containing protein n=1 Tax=Actinotalea lenta TaxID=3064654 RepID=A0ABT9DF96_9CELL|nr:glycoside hydrolase family 3 C-terminal domain-containing protein [Isoptericola sp. b441]MDO8108342.1 glycoside hydrolase family 3 C-terminal domain-containing protein [Isoptericola sp. b441]
MSTQASPFDAAVEAVRSGDDPTEHARRLYAQLTDEERLGLLDGDTPFWEGMAEMFLEGYNLRPIVQGQVERLGVPGVRFVDGPRGCVAGQGTAFPVSMARGATWDVALEERVGDAIGQEIRAMGGNFFGGVCINLPRHPAWGRAQETYGDDSYHLGELGAALTRGTQRWVMACAKHYALNSMENARFTVDVTADEATLHEVYLPHFKRVVDEGVAAIMSAYNSVNGQWCGQNEYLLTEVLRDLWGWDGITVSDFIWGLRDAVASLHAGLDLEEPFAQQRARDLPAALADGRTSWDLVERAGVRLLAAQLRSYAARTPQAPGVSVMADDEHRALAREVAARAMVLLKNDPVGEAPVLPLDPSTTRIAVIGRLATAPNMGDKGSSDVRAPSHVTPVDGIRAAYPDADVVLVTDDDPAAAAEAAHAADVAIVVTGFDHVDEGEYVGSDTMTNPDLLALFPPAPEGNPLASERNVVMTGGEVMGGDRASLTLRPVDEEIIRAVAAANPRTVVAVVAAGTVLMERWRHDVPAVVMMWYAGMEGGHALADVLRGAANPSGRLPFAIPTSSEHLPSFDRDATAITYDRYHGQRLLDRLGVEPAYPHGFGLAYTTYAVEDAAAGPVLDGRTTVTAHVANTGARDGHHVVQVYGRRAESAGETALVGFAAVAVAAGERAEVEVPVSLTPLGRWNGDTRQIDLPDVPVVLEVGAHAHDAGAVLVHLPATT